MIETKTVDQVLGCTVITVLSLLLMLIYMDGRITLLEELRKCQCHVTWKQSSLMLDLTF